MFFVILIALLIGTGFYLLAADRYEIPFIKTSKAMKNLSQRQKKKTSTIDVWLGSFAQWLSRHIPLNEYKRMKLESDLQTAEMNITPQRHVANALVKAGLVVVLGIPLYFLFPLSVPVALIVAVAIYMQEYRGVSNRIRAKREAIEMELPRLVFTIDKTLMHSRDVLAMLDSYQENAGPELQNQLRITIADMRSGNYESALTRLEARVGSSMLSDVCRGLQGILRGDDTSIYWSTLGVKFSENQRMLLKREAMKAPGKVKRLSMCLLFCFMLVYIVVICTQIVTSMGAMFG